MLLLEDCSVSISSMVSEIIVVQRCLLWFTLLTVYSPKPTGRVESKVGRGARTSEAEVKP